MKWRGKSIIFVLLAGLTVLTNNEVAAQASIKLLQQKSLPFPSASGIEFHKNKLYIFGDNATHLLILSTDYLRTDSMLYWKGAERVIGKEIKPDIESAMMVQRGDNHVLYGIGSMSTNNRWRVYEISLADLRIKERNFFTSGKKFKTLSEINIEGSTEVNKTVVFCNRANDKTKRNQLLFWNWKDSIAVKEIALPKTKNTAGMSGLYYVKEKDLLLFTASEEATESAVADGQIGDSYLGWISGFSRKLSHNKFSPDVFLNLGKLDKAFSKQKIESVCAEEVSQNTLLLHLVADNDNGRSEIFKIELKL